MMTDNDMPDTVGTADVPSGFPDPPVETQPTVPSEVTDLVAKVSELATEVAQLRELFARRLYQDEARAQLYDALEEQSRKLSDVLTNREFTQVFLEVLLAVDDLLADGLTLEVARGVGEQILETFARRGVVQLEVGQTFDPSRHEAIGKAPATPEIPPGTVTAVARRGFLLRDKLLRPAQVVVAVE